MYMKYARKLRLLLCDCYIYNYQEDITDKDLFEPL